MEYSSKLLSDVVDEISRLPGIGKRSALRLALYLLKQPKENTLSLSKSLERFRTEINYCQKCHNLSESAICEICSNEKRNNKLICVVEDIRDVMAIETTNQYNGLYHVMGGTISPLEGISAEHIFIDDILDKVDQFNEIIISTNASIDGDTTSLYIQRLLNDKEIKITRLARGLPVGGQLEYVDEATLSKAIENRTNFND